MKRLLMITMVLFGIVGCGNLKNEVKRKVIYSIEYQDDHNLLVEKTLYDVSVLEVHYSPQCNTVKVIDNKGNKQIFKCMQNLYRLIIEW